MEKYQNKKLFEPIKNISLSHSTSNTDISISPSNPTRTDISPEVQNYIQKTLRWLKKLHQQSNLCWYNRWFKKIKNIIN